MILLLRAPYSFRRLPSAPPSSSSVILSLEPQSPLHINSSTPPPWPYSFSCLAVVLTCYRIAGRHILSSILPPSPPAHLDPPTVASCAPRSSHRRLLRSSILPPSPPAHLDPPTVASCAPRSSHRRLLRTSILPTVASSRSHLPDVVS
ncbi:hypothetical protein BC829DRAFT_491111 [Chytridium lagenaria]|nr:hypothetical protein BC829DRAFT_491111 [Chytridium lagenaria]